MKNVNICLNITEQCNLKCEWCYQQGHRSACHLATKRLPFLLDVFEALDVSSVSLIGGEPTVHPHFFEILSAVSDYSAVLVTNGLLFSNKTFLTRSIESGLQYVAFSIKGINRRNVELSTHVDCFNICKKAIANLKDSPLLVTYNLLFSENLVQKQSMDAAISFLEDMGISTIVVSDLRPYLNRDKVCSFPNITSSFEVFCYRLLIKGIDVVVRPNNPLCQYSEAFILDMLGQKRLQMQCAVRQGNTIHFNTNLNVVLCNEFRDVCLGRMDQDYTTPSQFLLYLKSIHSDPALSKLNLCPSIKCSTCNLWKYCGGSCMLHWIK